MKTVIVSLNSKYIHSSLAPWYLKSACGSECGIVRVLEFTINDNPDTVLAEVYGENPQVAAFSCYIWNMAFVMRLAENLRKVSPDIKIILGGPEVSYDADRILADNPFIDYVISGEGEVSFKKLIGYLAGEPSDISAIGGLTYRSSGSVCINGKSSVVGSLDSIPSPYTDEMLSSLRERIVYFEASRGCPFSCSYCLSSTTAGVRYFSPGRIESDLDRLVKKGVKQIKFVDRTFNCNKTRAMEIFRYILKDSSDTNFHFEAAADLFDEEMLDTMDGFPPGKVQLEIGIQTTNPAVHEAVGRRTDLGKAFENIGRLRAMGNIHLHLDLIAGLPLEDHDSFKKSFNEVYVLRPHQLQLGFLKMLKGTRSRKESDIHGYRYRSYPPYEILGNNYITFGEILELKGVEELVERYYNSGRFTHTLSFTDYRLFADPYGFYKSLLDFCSERGFLKRPLSSREQYTALWDFYRESGFCSGEYLEYVNELMKLDFLISDNSNNLPSGIERYLTSGFKEKCFDFLKAESSVGRYLPEYAGVPAKQIFKTVHFESFRFSMNQQHDPVKMDTVLLFNYRKRDRVTGHYEYFDVTREICRN